MPTLDKIQSFFRNAIVEADTNPIASLLASYPDPEKGVGIHQRNYQASLMLALLTKFPATAWLAGQSFMTEAREGLCKGAAASNTLHRRIW
jgi:hypothetical protein